MTETQYVQVIQFFLWVGVAWFAYSFLYRRTRVDDFREDIFTIRDQLFDYMWQHGLPYELPAYQQMRDSLNGMIRTAHMLNVAEFFLFAFFYRRGPRRHQLLEVIGEIKDPEVRKEFLRVYQVVQHRLVRFLFLEGVQATVFWPIIYLSRLKGEVDNCSPERSTIWREAKRRVSEIADLLTNDMVYLGKSGSPQAQRLRQMAPIRSRFV
ncbi:MAG: hypothetical protein KJ970_03635 [Candidatus Eisenbacteria bacterium]|uniref:Uncharacterized protein n=1 Tax=Eiseniibacteriota bacterium TaxID=2212470 RepID=A0A948WBI6_UNCEI|nr:hypothetical protein [Candidatus Eisenbacteria bacterium]MBU1947135.1 hypothetical protein [Candidatus Eisenbacteria bacterium]MBU2689993.1 hypothetical protein [Candidatus Eisenbacteria bacterium]